MEKKERLREEKNIYVYKETHIFIADSCTNASLFYFSSLGVKVISEVPQNLLSLETKVCRGKSCKIVWMPGQYEYGTTSFLILQELNEKPKSGSCICSYLKNSLKYPLTLNCPMFSNSTTQYFATSVLDFLQKPQNYNCNDICRGTQQNSDP